MRVLLNETTHVLVRLFWEYVRVTAAYACYVDYVRSVSRVMSLLSRVRPYVRRHV